MNIHRLLAHQTWWGKILGAFLGFLIAGPAGALFGLLVGNFFDRGLTDHFNNPFWQYHNEPRARVKTIFFEALFSTLGYVAKSDGRISEEEIEMANTLMQDMKLNSEQKKTARLLFNEGKKEHFKLKPTLTVLYKAAQDNPNLLKLFIDTQYHAAQIDGLSDKKIHILNIILKQMQFAPIHNQEHVREEAYRHYNQHYSSRSQQRNTSQTASYGLNDAYATLQLTPPSNKQETKRAYRRLMSQNHPDKLMAQGASTDAIKKANEKTQVIRKAYEKICAEKGW